MGGPLDNSKSYLATSLPLFAQAEITAGSTAVLHLGLPLNGFYQAPCNLTIYPYKYPQTNFKICRASSGEATGRL